MGVVWLSTRINTRWTKVGFVILSNIFFFFLEMRKWGLANVYLYRLWINLIVVIHLFLWIFRIMKINSGENNYNFNGTICIHKLVIFKVSRRDVLLTQRGWVFLIDIPSTTCCLINQCGFFKVSHDPVSSRIFCTYAKKDIIYFLTGHEGDWNSPCRICPLIIALLYAILNFGLYES